MHIDSWKTGWIPSRVNAFRVAFCHLHPGCIAFMYTLTFFMVRSLFLQIPPCIPCMCLCACRHVYATVHMWWSEESFTSSVSATVSCVLLWPPGQLSTEFLRISYLHLPSFWQSKRWKFSWCEHILVYVGPGGVHTSLHAWLASALSSDPCPSPGNLVFAVVVIWCLFFVLFCF